MTDSSARQSDNVASVLLKKPLGNWVQKYREFSASLRET